MGSAPVTKRAIDEALARAGLAPRRRWGQNFLIGSSHLERIVELAEVVAGEPVLEVGPGLGGLTERLLARGAWVVAAEIDPGYCRLLPELLDDPVRLRVVEGDVMQSKSALAPAVLEQLRQLLEETGGQTWKIVSNLPYQISSPFLAGLVLLERPDWTRAVLTLQKEVAGVVRADPGSSAYSPLSFLTGLYLQVTRGPRLGRDCFHPRPEVDSEVVVLEPRLEGRVPPRELLPFVRRLFQARRKALRGTVLPAFEAAGVALPREVEPADLLRAVGIGGGDRVDGIPRERLEELYLEGLRRGRMPASGSDGGGGC